MSSLLSTIRSAALIGCALFASLIMATACETAPPVQEMSDARQAIAVAREAGAETHATEALYEAERYLQSAQEQLNAENYAEARRDAIAAREKAQAARQLSERGESDDK